MTEAELRRTVAREDLCRLIAACYYEPDPAFAEAGLFDTLLAAASLVDPGLAPSARALGESFRSASPDALLLDYTRLFLGPMEILAKPYGSVWLSDDRTLMGEMSMAVMALYQEAGFEIDDEFRELPDHIAVELEFLYLLVFRENEARRLGDAAALATALALQHRFLAQHIGRWVQAFGTAIRENAQTAFYRDLAALTEQVVMRELADAEARAVP